MNAKIGIEIHQRLATRKKLFCGCSAEAFEEKPLRSIVRRLRAVPGELGEIDPAAAFEMKRERVFEYQIFPSSTCLIELDEEPPHEMNKEALEISLQVSLLLNATPVEEVFVMRKTVVDGSAVSGFQRTALVATNGWIETSRGKVGIPTVCLEEESSGIVHADEKKAVYRLDRQGIPLIEIATDATIKDGAHAREVAEKIGLLLRSTGRMQRGIGTIRQDLNVSVGGGARVEVKGVQELESLGKVIDFEVNRQRHLVEKGEKVVPETRKAIGNETEFMRPLPGSARMYPETDVLPVRITKEVVEAVRKNLPKSLDERKRAYLKMGLNDVLAEKMVRSQEFGLFEEIVGKTGADATTVAATVLETITSLRREGVQVERIEGSRLIDLFKEFRKGLFAKQAISELLKLLALEPRKTVAALLKENDLNKYSESHLKKIILELKKQGIPEKSLFAEIMKRHRLNVDAAELSGILR